MFDSVQENLCSQMVKTARWKVDSFLVICSWILSESIAHVCAYMLM